MKPQNMVPMWKWLFAIREDQTDQLMRSWESLQRYKVLIINGKNVTFSDVIATWKADRANDLSNTLGHLTADQMKPNNFQRQNVRMAFQLVSGKLTCAMSMPATKAVVSPMLNNTFCLRRTWMTLLMFVTATTFMNPLKKPLYKKSKVHWSFERLFEMGINDPSVEQE